MCLDPLMRCQAKKKSKYNHAQPIPSNLLPLGCSYNVTNSWKPLKGGDGTVTSLGCVWLELRLLNGRCV